MCNHPISEYFDELDRSLFLLASTKEKLKMVNEQLPEGVHVEYVGVVTEFVNSYKFRFKIIKGKELCDLDMYDDVYIDFGYSSEEQ